jgi:hypothetical protein
VVARERLDGVLLEDELHVIRNAGRVVWCHVRVPRSTRPATGAEAATRACEYLLEHVLHRRSPWLGLIFDVREGPSVFGPVTRQALSRLLGGAELSRKPVAVLTVGDGSQHAQFCSLAAEYAQQFALVTSEAGRASDWMTQAH